MPNCKGGECVAYCEGETKDKGEGEGGCEGLV